jgi:hypothetical protein
MRRLGRVGLLAAALALAAAGPSRAQEADAAIRGVISSQIEAFKADDFDMAFTFASPAIKRLFGNPERFGQMVQSGYPMVWRPAEVRFSGLATREGRTIQSVVVTDRDGALHVLDYEMVEGPDGWRINGVTLRRPGGAGA